MLHAVDLECVKGYDSLFSNINFTLNRGEVLQITGTNGSGKTSLLNILTGLSLPYHGEVFWQGTLLQDNHSLFHANLCYLGHKNGLRADLSAHENLQLMHSYLAQSTSLTIEQALSNVGLQGYEDILAHQLSAGQQRRVALARLLLSKSPLWILDEPTTAVDVDGVVGFEQTITKHLDNSGMVIFTSHQALTFGSHKIRELSLG